jgi:hypothetical protein
MKYRVKIVGSEDFIPESFEIVLNPKSKFDLNVLYHCKMKKE